MMQRNDLLAKTPITLTAEQSAVSSNKVLRNTYTLLSMTLLFSALTAGVAMATNAGRRHGYERRAAALADHAGRLLRAVVRRDPATQ